MKLILSESKLKDIVKRLLVEEDTNKLQLFGYYNEGLSEPIIVDYEKNKYGKALYASTNQKYIERFNKQNRSKYSFEINLNELTDNYLIFENKLKFFSYFSKLNDNKIPDYRRLNEIIDEKNIKLIQVVKSDSSANEYMIYDLDIVKNFKSV